MNKIGLVKLESKIKILDALNFPEEFEAIKLDIKSGMWIGFNVLKENVYSEEGLQIPSEFYLVEEKALEKNDDVINYNWEVQKNFISVEKGIIGVFNNDYSYSEEHDENCLDVVSNDLCAGTLNGIAIVVSTHDGNDGYFSFSVVKEDNKIIALKINLEED